MNEEVKTAITLLISPFLFSILVFVLKKVLAKYEESQKQIIQSLSKLKGHIYKTNSEISLVKLNINSLESSVLSQDKLISKEVESRNKKLDRNSQLLIKLSEKVAILDSKVN